MWPSLANAVLAVTTDLERPAVSGLLVAPPVVATCMSNKTTRSCVSSAGFSPASTNKFQSGRHKRCVRVCVSRVKFEGIAMERVWMMPRMVRCVGKVA